MEPWLLLAGAVGGGSLSALIQWLSGRRQRKVGLAEKSVATAEEAVVLWREAMSAKMTVLEQKIDLMSRHYNDLFEEVRSVYRLLEENGNGH